MELPVNRPLAPVSNDNIDGAMQTVARQGDVNYEPTTVAGNPVQETQFGYSPYAVNGMTQQKPIDKQDNFRQAGEFYRALSKHEQDDLIKNLAADLGQVKSMPIKQAMVSHFYQGDKDYGTQLAAATGVDIKSVEKMTSAAK
jgi:catalase